MSFFQAFFSVPAAVARQAGATNHGYYCFIPMWIDARHQRMAAKWPPMDLVAIPLVWFFSMVFGGVNVWIGPSIEE